MMNRLTIVASVVLLAASPHHAIGQTGFNGVITFSLHNENGKNQTLIQTQQGNKLVIQVGDSGSTPSGAFILDGDAHTVTLVLPAQQQYMRMTDDEMKQRAAMMGGGMNQSAATSNGTASVVNTGRTETIAGVTCQVYHASGTEANGKSGEGDLCVAKGVGLAVGDLLGNFGRMGGMGRSNTSAMMSQVGDLTKNGNGVLKITEIKNGQAKVILVATNIDRTPPPSSIFEPPAAYTQMHIPQMPAGGMPGGMPGGMKPPG